MWPVFIGVIAHILDRFEGSTGPVRGVYWTGSGVLLDRFESSVERASHFWLRGVSSPASMGSSRSGTSVES